jgi:hypothetical protein
LLTLGIFHIILFLFDDVPPTTMIPMPAKILRSPCQRFEARLSPVGSGWDVSRASLVLHDLSFGARIFGWQGAWSPCSRYFAITEWLRVDTDHGPDMQLLVIDVREGRECVVEHVTRGFIEPMFFRDDAIKYSMIAKGMDERIALHRQMGELDAWRPLSGN